MQEVIDLNSYVTMLKRFVNDSKSDTDYSTTISVSRTLGRSLNLFLLEISSTVIRIKKIMSVFRFAKNNEDKSFE